MLIYLATGIRGSGTQLAPFQALLRSRPRRFAGARYLSKTRALFRRTGEHRRSVLRHLRP